LHYAIEQQRRRKEDEEILLKKVQERGVLKEEK